MANGNKDLKDKNEIMINTYLHTHYVPECLNDELEIIEEDKKIEKLVGVDKGVYIDYNMCDIVGKINEIIDKINEVE